MAETDDQARGPANASDKASERERGKLLKGDFSKSDFLSGKNDGYRETQPILRAAYLPSRSASHGSWSNLKIIFLE